MNADAPRPAGRFHRYARWPLWALAASLALNGFLIGAILSGYFVGERERRGMFYLETRIIGQNLPEEQADALRSSLRELVPEMRPNWRRLRELRREINELAAMPEPDREQIDARLAEIRAITSAMQAEVQMRVFDEVLALPPDMRARLAEDDQ